MRSTPTPLALTYALPAVTLAAHLFAACDASAPEGDTSSSTLPPAPGAPTPSDGPDHRGDRHGAAPRFGAPAVPAEPAEPAPVPYAHFDVNHVLATGQSNCVGNGASPALSTTQPFGNLMFDTGVITATWCDPNGCRSHPQPRGLVPLVEGDSFFGYPVETASAGMANLTSELSQELLRAATPGRRHDVLVSAHGRSGNTYGCLRKGGCDFKGPAQGYIAPFAEAMAQVADAKALAVAAGRSYVVRAVTAIHGESDHYSYSTGTQEFPVPGTDGVSTVNDYADAMIEWQRDYETDVRAITGQAEPVPLFLLQMDNWTDVPHSPIPMFMLEAHRRALRKVVVVAPAYPIGLSPDCLHYTNHGERRIGEYFAKAYARVVIEGRPWEPVRPRAITLAGAVIRARFFVPRPPLVLDTTRVVDPGNYGFEYHDDSGAPPAIASVTIAAPDVVQITLTRAPTGANKRLRYAFTATPNTCPGPETGPRGNLRDSDATRSRHGYDLHNWGVHFDEPIW